MTVPAILQNLLTKYFRWTVLVVVLIITGLGYTLFLSNVIAELQTTSFTQRDRAKNELVVDQRYASQLGTAIQKFKAIFTPAELTRLNAVLPTKTEFPSLLLTIKDIAATAGLQLENITITQVASAAASSAPVSTTPSTGVSANNILQQIPQLAAQDATIQVSGGASYDGFKKFLGLIESSEQLFDVLSLNFATPTLGGTGAAAQYSLTLRSYTYQLPTRP